MKYLIIVTLSILTIHLAYSSTKKATITAHCYSFQLSPLDWKDGDITYFTTYDGTSGQPYNSNGIVSSEVKPTTIGSSAYRTDFLGIDALGIYSYGTVSMTIPSTDSDNNGVPDFLQKEKSVNSSVNYNAVTHWDRYGDYEATPPATVLFTRSANSSSGTYQITHSDGVNITSYNYSGTWHINSWTGEVTYDENKNITINVSSLTAEGATVNVTGTGQYNYISETLSLGGINLTDGADTIQTKNAELVRSGSTYSGQLSLKDGEVDTPWVDYANWKVFIMDRNDHDSDGIPDLTDPEPTASGNEETKSSQYVLPGGWYWLGAYPWAYSHQEQGWLYCHPTGDGLYMYSVQNKSWSKYQPQSQ